MLFATVPVGAFQETLPYIPQRFGVRFNAAGDFSNRLTVTGSKSGELLNITSAGLKAWGQSNGIAAMSATDDVFYVELAAGYDPSETITIVGTCTGGSIDFYAKSQNMNTTGMKYKTSEFTVVTQTNQKLDKFSKLIIVGMTSSDDLLYVSQDGVTEKVNLEEVEAMAGMVCGSTALAILYNQDQLAAAYYLNSAANRSVLRQQMTIEGSTNLQEIANKVGQNVQKAIGNSPQKAATLVKATNNQKLLTK